MKIVVLRLDNMLEQIEVPRGTQVEVFEGTQRCAITLRNGLSHVFNLQGKYLGAGVHRTNPTELMGDSVAAYEAQRVIQPLPDGG